VEFGVAVRVGALNLSGYLFLDLAIEVIYGALDTVEMLTARHFILKIFVKPFHTD